MEQELEKLRLEGLAAMQAADSIPDLQQIKASFVGKKGSIGQYMERIREVPPEARPAFGQLVNRVKQEITDKVTAVTDEDVKTWYDQNQGRVRGKTIEEVGPQIKNFLQQMRSAERHDIFINSLKQDAAVKIMLEPPRQDVKVAADDPAKGPASAPVQIVEYSDFQ